MLILWTNMCLPTNIHDTQGFDEAETKCRSHHHDSLCIGQAVLVFDRGESINSSTDHLTSFASPVSDKQANPALRPSIVASDCLEAGRMTSTERSC